MKSLEPRVIDAIDTVQKKPELQPFFFRELKGLKYFNELEKRGFFEASKNPAPKETEDKGFYVIPFWPVLEYLERTAPELQIEENREYADKFLAIMRLITKASIESGISNYRTWWYFAKLLGHIPIDRIIIEDIGLCSYWLRDPFDRMVIGEELGNKLLPRLLSERTCRSNQLSVKLVEALTQLRWIEKPHGVKEQRKPVLLIEEYHANKLFRNQSKRIGEVLERSGLSIFKARIEEILETYEKDKYSVIWRPAIEDHDQNKYRHDAINIMITAFREALSGYIERKAYAPTEVCEYISELLKHRFKIFQRIGIHAIGAYFDVLRGLASRLIDPIYFTSQYRHEMFHFLRVNFSKFEESNKSNVLQIIDSLSVEDGDSEEIRTKRISYEKLIWLAAIKRHGYERADELYSQNYSISGHTPEHPDFSFFMEVGWVGEISPYKADELLSRGVDELVELLESFKEQGGWKTPTVRGLAEELKHAVKNNPDYFKGNLPKFMPVNLGYIYEIIQAYKELWSEKGYDNWSELLDFCIIVINREGFWSEKDNERTASSDANRSWIVGAIGDLLRAGTASDEKAFEPPLLPKAKTLLLSLLEKQESVEFESGCDAMSVSINSAKGKCIEALVNFALRSCRLANKEKGKHDETWKELEPIFERELSQTRDGNYEFITLFANYLPNFLYLSPDWTLTHLSQIFSLVNRKQWLCAMQGYAYVGTVYPDIYRFMKKGGHFLEALNASELKEETKKKVIQNIVISYIQGEELFEDKMSLINVLLDRWNAEEINEIIWFIWTLRNHEESLCNKVLSLWGELKKRIIGKEEDNRNILSALCLWSSFILEITADALSLLKQAAPYAEIEHHSYIVVEELKRLVDRYPIEVAEVFISMLQKFAPTYAEEDIKYILRSLYGKSSIEIRNRTNEIVDKYIANGIDFPAKLREELVR